MSYSNVYFNVYSGYWMINDCSIEFVTENEALEFLNNIVISK